VEAGVDSIEHGWGLTQELVERMARQKTAWTPTLAMLEDAIATLERKGRDARPRRETLERLASLIPQAMRLGVSLLAGTDVLPHGQLARELDALRSAGLEPWQALAVGSTWARAYLGRPGLEEGAPADLLLWEDDPRGNPEILGRPETVMFGGRVLGAA
jgi:imidazolonepropionase-like amidohydrolase